MTPLFHLIVYVPVTHADAIRSAMAEAGAGRIGNYDSCSFSTRGTGRFRPLAGADPQIGKAGRLESVDEERIEAVVKNEDITAVLDAVRKTHPYEEPAVHVLPMMDDKQLL